MGEGEETGDGIRKVGLFYRNTKKMFFFLNIVWKTRKIMQ